MKEQLRSISVPGIYLEQDDDSDSSTTKSELLGQLDPNHETSGARASSVVSSGIKDTLGQQIRPGTLYEVLMALKERESTETLTDQDIENKFTSLSLAFKTDKLTLTNRLELQQRQRDIAEKNIDVEIAQLKKEVEELSQVCLDGEAREVLKKIQQQVDVVKQTAERISSSAEVYGAVQQEARIARAVEIMLMYVDNLKRNCEREHTELEESRKLLAANNLSVEDQWRSNSGLEVSSSPTIGRPNSRGRSVSVIHPNQGSPTNTLGAALNSPKTRRASHQPIQQSPSKISSAANSATGSSNNPSSSFTFSKVNRKMGLVTPVGISGRTLGSVSESGFEEGSQQRHKKSFMDKDNGQSEENNNYQHSTDSTGKKSSDQLLASESATSSRPKIRSLSLIEPVKEEDENALMDEIDHLARQRNSSLAPLHFRQTLRAIRPISVLQRIRDWYNDLYWPYDYEETILGLRYVATGILLLAALISLLMTFVNSKPVIKS